MSISEAVRGALVFGAICALIPAVNSCGKGGMPGGGGMPGVPGGEAACPTDPAAIMNASFGLKADAEGKLKAGLSASAHLQALAGRIEGEVATACGGLAKDLGATDADLAPKEEGPGKKAEAACGAAAKLIGEFKAKAQGELSVEAQPPRCSASIEAYADCAASCDANVEPGKVDVKCEEGKLSGQCDGKCEGSCTVEAAGACEGTCSGSCSGSCDAGFSGKCGGNCEGTCDGKNTSGKCAGNCEGKCSAKAEGSCSGSCKGQCSASCQVEASGECSGTCSGSCDVEMKAPKCDGEITPPEMSAECEANCDASAEANIECTPATVTVMLSGSADAEAATKLETALRNNLPALLKVTMGMKDAAMEVTGSVKTTLEGVQGLVKADASAQAALKAGACVAAAIKAQVQATASISVSVKASASASGEAGVG